MPLNSAQALKRKQTRFFGLMKSVYYLLGRVRHQFTGEFGIPVPPPKDMASRTVTRAAVHLSIATVLGGRSRYIIREADREDYLEWFSRVGRLHLFSEELRESQRAMQYFEDWGEVICLSTVMNFLYRS